MSVLIAIRNFLITALLAWMGFSLVPDKDESEKQQPENNSAAYSLILQH